MDGNGRWAVRRGLPRIAGHQAGVNAVRKTVEYSIRRGIGALTLFAFSSENWRRPSTEVGFLMDLIAMTLDREIDKLHNSGARLRVIGDRSALRPELQRRIDKAESLTQANRRLDLTIALNYGGRWEIVEAARRLAQQVAERQLDVQDITADTFAAQLCLPELPEPDVFIRTGGEQRISNFLLWQLAYAELFFTPVLWPDFDETALDLILDEFARRERRFGYTSEQLAEY